ncbi:MAG: FG-GAP repeat protein [Deltaproteobacteria bacterium]|nr:FG-GAP repeat protein [Deltaproteobacteria bacterium]
MSISWRRFATTMVAAVLASGCSVMGFFDETPAEGCRPGEERSTAHSCGVCDQGTTVDICNDEGVFEFARCANLDLDADGDGVPNAACEDLAGGCCTEERDCNDGDPALGVVPAGGCGWLNGTPDEEQCTTACGTPGTHECTAACTWGACAATATTDDCDDVDDDCDTATDEDVACRAGEEVSCRTSCDLPAARTGRGTCTAECTEPSEADCTPPLEACDGRDNDCDTATDNGFPCVQGTTMSCNTSCGGEFGTGRCSIDCLMPAPGDCTPPPEMCNGVDDDCDTAPDNGFACIQGHLEECETSCDSTGTGVCTSTCGIPGPSDCTPPGEACLDGADNDCDTLTDELEAGQCTPGAPVACRTSCDGAAPAPMTGSGTCTALCQPPLPADCTPPAETCNGRDDDCDTVLDEGFDCVAGAPGTSCTTTCTTTGTGTCTASCQLPAPADCTPPAEVCNGIDDNCTGGCDEPGCCRGSDRSCTTSCGSTGTEHCSTACSWEGCVAPPETCNGDDDDCDTVADEGYDCIAGDTVACTTACGTTGTGACTAACEFPAGADCFGGTESCNALDDNCNGSTDEGFACVQGRSTTCTTTCGSTGTGTCTAACDLPAGAACTAPPEICNGDDDDCDGTTDDGFACVVGRTVPCTTTCGTTGSGTCTAACAVPGPASCTAPVETCNGLNDDCAGGCDDGFPCCAGSVVSCTTSCGSTGTGTCSGSCAVPAGAACAAPAESCNGADDDCDTVPDNGFACVLGTGVACTTSCGTTGTGTCTGACGIPAPASCTAPAETCNGADDDCDTVADDGFPLPAAPNPTWPGNCARTGSHLAPGARRPTFRWLAVAAGSCGAITYDLQVDDSCTTPGFASCTFPSPAVNATALATASYRPAADLAINTASRPFGTRFYWRVRACDPFRCGAWSPVRYVDVGRAPNDFDGDGYSDLLVGAPREGVNAPGRVRLFLGGAPPDATADATMDGTAPGAGFGDFLGEAVGGAGDVNGDGFADFLAGARNAPTTSPGDGRAYLFLGGASPNLVADVTYVPVTTGGGLGRSVAGAGDINGDGFADVIIGARNVGPPSNTGRAYVYLGGTSPDAVFDVELAPLGTGEQFGTSVAGAGDVNGDGFGDVVVGAYAWNGSGLMTGRAYMFLGGAAMDTTYDVRVDGTAAGAYYGSSVSAAGDFNDDGFADFVFGASGLARAEVFYGGTTVNATPDVVLTSASQYFGGSVARAGDANGDGIGDLLVGAYGASLGVGAAYLYLGAASPSTTAAQSAVGSVADDNFGTGVGGAGDVNGDGFADCLAGAPGTLGGGHLGYATLLWGASPVTWASPATFTGASANSLFGTGVASIPP